MSSCSLWSGHVFVHGVRHASKLWTAVSSYPQVRAQTIARRLSAPRRPLTCSSRGQTSDEDLFDLEVDDTAYVKRERL